MAKLTTVDGRIKIDTKSNKLVLSPKPGGSDPCCCVHKICWHVSRGALFSASADDLSVTASSDLSGCAVIVDYFSVQCPFEGSYSYLSPSVVAPYVRNGGVYITNCEWDNCGTYGPGGGCDGSGAGFQSHMSAIGASLSRGAGTISTNPAYSNMGSKIFEGCSVSGNATSGIEGGIPLLLSSKGFYCENESGGICCAGTHVGEGAVIGFGDSNVNISGSIRDNLLNNSAADLF